MAIAMQILPHKQKRKILNNTAASPLQLHAHVSGDGHPMVFLHGLFGSWQNLGTAVRAAAEHYQVHALDLRNHGKSPHHGQHDYPALAADVAAYIDEHIGQACYVLGHSMGGKTAMQLALTRPELIDKLIVVDIAPRAYPPHHDEILQGLSELEGKPVAGRREADQALAVAVPELAVRSFLLKNLVLEDGIVHWRMNLTALREQYAHIADWPATQNAYSGPVLFLKGANSDYIEASDRESVLKLFPAVQLKTIAATGHWPHAEKTTVFNKLMLDFLAKD